jgi:nucleotide-binding universal stress UspA family protein
MVTSGDPTEAIVSEASQRPMDVVVIGDPRLGRGERWALSSVADYALRATPMPLLPCAMISEQ